jgi:hypothetical protein
MEVRCGNCHKLFRIPDEKITEKGIQFICTRCGEYVAVKKEELNEPQRSDAGSQVLTSAAPERSSAGVKQKQEEQVSLFSDFAAAVKPVSTPEHTTAPDLATDQTIGTDPVAVRCDACKKLFRVPGHKISGSGVKFVCTRCGEYVSISSQDINRYIFPSDPRSVPDISATEAQSPETVTLQQPEEKSDAGTEAEPTVPREATETQPSTEPAQPVLKDIPEQNGPEPEPLSVSFETPQAEQKTEPVPEMKVETDIALKIEDTSLPESETFPVSFEIPHVELKTEPVPEVQVETDIAPKIEDMSLPQPEPTPAISLTMATQKGAASRTVSGPTEDSISAILLGERTSEVPHETIVPKKERSLPEPPRYGKTVAERHAIRSRKLLPLLIAGLAVICLLVYGAMWYLKMSPETAKESQEPSSMEGLLITSVTGTMEPNGDILISGMVQNTLAKEKNAWFVVVEVYNRQGAQLNKIRLLNGKQLFTKRDYDVLAARGVNVRDLKERSLQEQGIVIAPKGSVSFEVRYIQPPAEIASFKAVLLPFDPVRLFREISEDAR